MDSIEDERAHESGTRGRVGTRRGAGQGESKISVGRVFLRAKPTTLATFGKEAETATGVCRTDRAGRSHV